MRTLYTIGILLMGLGLRFAALFSAKAKAWVTGRHDLIPKLAARVMDGEKWIWVHAASLGEFEQGRPLIEKIKHEHPEIQILLTFFSPSGYSVRKDYEFADYVTYIPLDTARLAEQFVKVLKPIAAVFVKYEIWYNHLAALERHKVPVYLISSNLRPGQIYFTVWGKFLRKRLYAMKQIFTQTSESEQFLKKQGFENVSLAGDTRLDRVLDIAGNPRDFGWLSKCIDGSILIAGSTWPEDEQRLIPALLSLDYPAIIAPHEIHSARIAELIKRLPSSAKYSELRLQPRKVKYVIVDTIGDLAYLYAIGRLAYVGGAFRQGLHNVLEPVAHRLPVIIGPEFSEFAEAAELVKKGIIEPIDSFNECEKAITIFNDTDRRDAVTNEIVKYIERNRGATDRIYEAMNEVL